MFLNVSIITVCYNSAKTIVDTIRSVNTQTYPNIEHIFVDGLSLDNTVELIRLNSNRNNLIISEKDEGLYDAINKGIALATGDIIGILNSDDIFSDMFVLENIAKFHQENDIDASIGNVTQFNESGRTVRKYSSKSWTPENLKIGFMPPHPSIFFKRDLFVKYGNYRLDFISGADYELIIRFFLINKITWKYSGITTTAMLIGGISSSGYKSYKLISREIKKSLELNNIKFSYFKVLSRVIWKLNGIFKKK